MTAGLDVLVPRIPDAVLSHPDIHRRFVALVPYFAEMAEIVVGSEAQPRSNKHWYSYRNFPVLALTVMDGIDIPHQGILVAGNIKPNDGSKRVCAEPRIYSMAAKARAATLPGLFLRAPGDRSEIMDVCGGRRRATLPPCHHCTIDLEMMQAKAQWSIDAEMPIVTTAFKKEGYQVATPYGLSRFYRDLPVPRQFNWFVPNYDGWQDRLALYDEWRQSLGGAAIDGTKQGQLMQATLLVPLKKIESVRIADGWRDVLAA